MIRENPDRNSSQVRRGKSGDSFPATQWSLVVHASRPLESQAQAALEDLCGRYWYPLYVYARRHVRGPEEAQDLIQEFRELALTPEAARQALHRLRKRYRALLRDEIAQTVSHPDQVEDELRALRAALE